MVLSVPKLRFVSALFNPQPANGAVGSTSMRSGSVLCGALVVALSGCSLILDFDTPLEAAIDGGSTIDSAIVADASSAPDAVVTQICNASDLELEGVTTNDTSENATVLNGGAMTTLSSILCTETDATPDVDFFSFMIGAAITEDITITLSPVSGQNLGIRLRQSNVIETVISEASSAVNNVITANVANQSQLPGGELYYLEVYSIPPSSAKVGYELSVVRVPNPPPM